MKLKELVDKYIKEYKALTGILLVGSRSKGTHIESSDIDLCLIGDFDDFSRVKEIYQEVPVELMIGPLSWYEQVITEYERQDNVGTITNMIAFGKILYSTDESIENLLEIGRVYWSKGPTPTSTEVRRKYKEKVVKSCDELCSIESGTHTYQWMLYKYVDLCVEAFFHLGDLWMVKDRYVLETIKEVDCESYQLIASLLSQPKSSFRNPNKENLRLLRQRIVNMD